MTQAATPPTESPGPGSLRGYRDQQHLKTLSVLFVVLAATTLLFGCVSTAYMGVGSGMLFFHADAIAAEPNAPPDWVIPLMSWGLAALGVVLGLYQLAVGILFAMTARYLATRRSRIFCLVVAGLACLSVPLGTAVGVYTFVILTRPEVIALFGGRTARAIGR